MAASEEIAEARWDQVQSRWQHGFVLGRVNEVPEVVRSNENVNGNLCIFRWYYVSQGPR